MHNKTREERKEMGKVGRGHILDKYSLAKYAEAWEGILDRFIEKNGSWTTRKGYNGVTVKEF
jgi:hypothetical protein